MELMDLYNNIKNPIDDTEIIKKLIEIYKENGSGPNKMYSGIISSTSKEYKYGQHFISYRDTFYSKMFNDWKKSVCDMTKEEFIKLYKLGYYNDDFIKLREYLLDLPDITTYDEFMNLVYAINGDSEIKQIMRRYIWKEKADDKSGWIHLFPEYLDSRKPSFTKIEHRLYLNMEIPYIYPTILVFIDKCEEKNIPYYLKYSTSNRDDMIVIYSSTENLNKYIEILYEIAKEEDELIKKFMEPPILSGRINDWLGYGSDPIGVHGESYNGKRSKLLIDVIESCTRNWLLENLNNKISVYKKVLSFNDYILLLCVKEIISNIEKNVPNFKENLKIPIEECENQILETLKHNFNLEKALNNFEFEPVLAAYDNNKEYKLDSIMFQQVFRNLAKEISKNDPNFVIDIQKLIKERSESLGIDPNNFAFDIENLELMRKYDEKILDNKYNETQKEIEEISYSQTDLAMLNSNNIIEIINPMLLNKDMKLPNGINISAKEYIQEYLYPLLPAKGNVILKNGTVLTIKQFIEEFIMGECQTEYNGDAEKYINENVESQNGKFRFKNNSE